jgi:hypothetical protein
MRRDINRNLLKRLTIYYFIRSSIPSPIMAKQAAVWQSEWN